GQNAAARSEPPATTGLAKLVPPGHQFGPVVLALSQRLRTSSQASASTAPEGDRLAPGKVRGKLTETVSSGAPPKAAAPDAEFPGAAPPSSARPQTWILPTLSPVASRQPVASNARAVTSAEHGSPAASSGSSGSATSQSSSRPSTLAASQF